MPCLAPCQPQHAAAWRPGCGLRGRHTSAVLMRRSVARGCFFLDEHLASKITQRLSAPRALAALWVAVAAVGANPSAGARWQVAGEQTSQLCFFFVSCCACALGSGSNTRSREWCACVGAPTVCGRDALLIACVRAQHCVDAQDEGATRSLACVLWRTCLHCHQNVALRPPPSLHAAVAAAVSPMRPRLGAAVTCHGSKHLVSVGCVCGCGWVRVWVRVRVRVCVYACVCVCVRDAQLPCPAHQARMCSHGGAAVCARRPCVLVCCRSFTACGVPCTNACARCSPQWRAVRRARFVPCPRPCVQRVAPQAPRHHGWRGTNASHGRHHRGGMRMHASLRMLSGTCSLLAAW
jgi:hypothetical protein